MRAHPRTLKIVAAPVIVIWRGPLSIRFAMGAIVVLALFSTNANAAFNFPLTVSEWDAWPEYCRAKATFLNKIIPAGRKGVPTEVMKKWENTLGFQTWNNIHHGCQAIIHIARAERMAAAASRNPSGEAIRQYEYQLHEANGEATYSFTRTPADHPVYFKMGLILARVDYAKGNRAAAIQKMRQFVANAPDQAETSSTLAVYLYKEKQYQEARKVLEAAIVAVPVPTAELHYFLGLTLVRLNEFAAAREQAEKAYELGYPLPGLRNKLKSSGHWTKQAR